MSVFRETGRKSKKNASNEDRTTFEQHSNNDRTTIEHGTEMVRRM